LNHYLAYEPFFIGVPMLIMEIMKVLCQWSGFLNFEGVKTNESKYDSIELTDLENGGLTSSNVQLLAL